MGQTYPILFSQVLYTFYIHSPATNPPGAVVGNTLGTNTSKLGNKTNRGGEWSEEGEWIKMETIDGIRTALLSLEVDRPHLACSLGLLCGDGEIAEMVGRGNATELLGKTGVGLDK